MTTKTSPDTTAPADVADEEDYVPGPVRLRVLGRDLTIAGRPVPAGYEVTVDPGVNIAWMYQASRAVQARRAEVVGTWPGWLPHLDVRLRAIGGATFPGRGIVRDGEVYDYRCDTRDQLEQCLWGIRCGQYERADTVLLDWWPKEAMTTTRPTNRPIGEAWASH